MSLTETPVCNFGEKIKDFKLISTEDTFVSLKDIKGQNGTLIMFICNHCPYVKAVIKELVDVTDKISNFGINSVAIMSNDVNNYPEDSFEVLRKLNKKWDWIYIDPSRRNDAKGKVFMLKDCLPNVPDLLDFYFESSNC